MLKSLKSLILVSLAVVTTPVLAQSLDNPLPFEGGRSGLVEFAKFIYSNIIGLLVFLIFLALIWAGFRFVIALGNPDELKKARQNLKWVLIGAIIILLAGAIIELLGGIVEDLLEPTRTNG